MTDPSVDPPNSRLFILCSKSVSEEELRDVFSNYGTIEDVWIVKDKGTGENKGVVYIKFSKTSEAALAMEEMNGKPLTSNQKPLKIMIAHSREQGSKREDDSERLVRLFIVVARTVLEEEIREHFKQFGDVDHVTVVRNRDTGESKGFAYVKYHRPYHAAKAYEECSRSYKAVFARPREQKPSYNPYESTMDKYHMGSAGSSHSSLLGSRRSGDFGARWSGEEGAGSTRLTALVNPMLREQHVYRLFDVVPGLEICRPIHEPRAYHNGLQKILIQYSSPAAAQHALEKLSGFEYPPGHRISIKMEPPVDSSNGYSSNRMREMVPGGSSNEADGSNATMISNAELATLTKALAKAESIIKAAGLGTGNLGAGDGDSFDANYCSVKLPPPQPLASTTEPVERLFIVCQPGLPPMYTLRDVFGRFGNLVEVYVLNGKNCGYVSYASKESAEEAIAVLHLQEVCGMRLKVMKAEPPPGGPMKRPKVDPDN